ncbi:MAG: hypothetical protein M3N26_04410 [Pseudomonadota bacterium]|nr:hypothetical protein [Pseudomonadota bacterium]
MIDLRIWGDQESDYIRIWFDGDEIESLQIRLDVSHLSLTLISQLCVIAQTNDWVSATGDGAIVQPTREAVARVTIASRANKFVQDPQGYLEAAIWADGGLD